LEAYGIPYGTYEYVVAPKDSKLAGLQRYGKLTVRKPELWVTLGPPLNVIVDSGGRTWDVARSSQVRPALVGKISPVPAGDARTWVLVQSLYADAEPPYEAAVDPSGEFRLYARLHGTYIFVVLHGDQVLHCQVVSFLLPLGGSPVVTLQIGLGKNPVPVTQIP
jgi:hypothetical protein